MFWLACCLAQHTEVLKRDKEGEESGNNKGAGGVVTTIATATNALNSLK